MTQLDLRHLFERYFPAMRNSALKKLMLYTSRSLTASLLVHKETVRGDNEPC